MKNDLTILYGNALSAKYDQVLFRPLPHRANELLKQLNIADDVSARSPRSEEVVGKSS